MTHFTYLDEFGHVGPYVARTDPKYRSSPVFGLAGFVLPADEVRGFGTWFYQRKRELLSFEIDRSGRHPDEWEKKWSSLYTVNNVHRYPELRRFTSRLLNKIEALGGFVFYVGIQKTASPERHDPNRLYARVFLEAVKRIDQFCARDCNPPENFVLILDEHSQRRMLVAQAAQSMYARRTERRRHLIQPPFHVESYLYQTLQAADWIAGLVGCLGAVWAEPAVWPENNVFRRYFERRINRVSCRSGIRLPGDRRRLEAVLEGRQDQLFLLRRRPARAIEVANAEALSTRRHCRATVGTTGTSDLSGALMKSSIDGRQHDRDEAEEIGRAPRRIKCPYRSEVRRTPSLRGADLDRFRRIRGQHGCGKALLEAAADAHSRAAHGQLPAKFMLKAAREPPSGGNRP